MMNRHTGRNVNLGYLPQVMRVVAGTLLSVALSVSVVSANDDITDPRFYELMNAYHAVYGFSGTIKVIRGEQPVFEQSIGLANRSFGIPVRPETRNSINSVSKVFTAMAIMILVDEGKVALSSPISAYLPQLTAPWRDTVTIEHLLTHTAGLPRESGVLWHDAMTLEQQATRLVDKQALLFEPGARYAYSNAGVILLGAVIEQVSKTRYEDFVMQRIIAPLGLENTGVYEGRAVVERQAEPYRFTPEGVTAENRTKHLGTNAGGGLYSTASDLYAFMLAVEQNKLIPASLTARMLSEQVQSGEGEFEGYLWSIKYAGDDKLYFAAGSGYGTKSVMLRDPANKDFIAITSNWGNTPILPLLQDVFLTMKGEEVALPSTNKLAKPSAFSSFFGRYHFDPDALKQHLGADSPVIRLHGFDGKVFLNDELLAAGPDDTLKLTYTSEMVISVNEDKMTITINGNEMVGYR